MSIQSGQNSVSLVENQPFIDLRNARIESVSIDPTTVDATNTPTTQLRRGLVLGYDSAGLNYVDAGDALVDAHTKGTIDSAEAPDGDWDATTLTVAVPGIGRIVYTLGSETAISNLATAIADINDGPLGTLVFASDNGSGLLRLQSVKEGATLSVKSSLATAYAAGANVETTNTGSLTKYGILYDPIPSMLGIADSAADRNAAIVTANAIVRESDLLGLTTAAREYFAQNNIVLA